MNEIVREHYPVERLPDDLRQALGFAQTVTLIKPDAPPPRQRDRAAAVAKLLEHRKGLEASALDDVERVRTLRDEWDR